MSYLDQIEDVRQGYLERLDVANAEKRAEYQSSCAEFLIEVPGQSTLLGNLFRFDIAGVFDGNVKISDTHGSAAALSFSMEGLSGMPITFKAFAWDCAIFRTPGQMLPMVEIAAWFDRWIGAGEQTQPVPKSIQEMSAWFEGAAEASSEHRGFIHGVGRVGGDTITVDFGTASLSAFDELLLIVESAGAPELEIDAGLAMSLFDEVVGKLQEAPSGSQASDEEFASDGTAGIAGPGVFSVPEMSDLDDPEQSPEIGAAALSRAEGAQGFFAWFAENGAHLAALADRAADAGDGAEGGVAFAAVESEILQELAKVDDGLGCTVMPGEQRRFALVFSPRRQAALVPVALGLASQAPDLSDWEFQAFRPPCRLDRPIEVMLADEGPGGETARSLRIDPASVQVSLRPKTCRFDFVLHVSDADPGTERRMAQAGPQLLEAALGERGYIEGVATVSVETGPVQDEETFPLPQTPGQFAKHSASLRMAFRKLREVSPADAIAALMEPLENDIEGLERALFEYGHYEPIKLSLAFWGGSRDQKAKLESAFPEFEIWAVPALSLIGEGYEFDAEGVCPVGGGDLRAWLADKLASMFGRGLAPIRVAEQEIVPPGMERLINSRATALMGEEQWAEAATMLRHLIGRLGADEEGFVHAKAGLCYLRAGHPQPAIPLLERALEMLQDEDLAGQVHNYLGIALQDAGAIEDAYTHFQKAVALDPAVGARHYNLGQYYALLGDPEEASKHLGEAIRKEPELVTLLLEDEDLEPFRKTSWFKKLKVKKARQGRGTKQRPDKSRPKAEDEPQGAVGRMLGRIKKSA